jgi:hypothetical protein
MPKQQLQEDEILEINNKKRVYTAQKQLRHHRRDDGLDTVGDDLESERVHTALGGDSKKAEEVRDVGRGVGKGTIPTNGEVAGSASVKLRKGNQ